MFCAGGICFVVPAIRRLYVCNDAGPGEHAMLRLFALRAREPKPRLL
jgi:hypothetical protein